jgi:hypothetical protein
VIITKNRQKQFHVYRLLLVGVQEIAILLVVATAAVMAVTAVAVIVVVALVVVLVTAVVLEGVGNCLKFHEK